MLIGRTNSARRPLSAGRQLFILAALAAALALTTGLAFAHGGAEVEVDPPQAQPGGSITVTGSGIEPDIPVTVSLESAAGVFPLGTVTTDDEGMFSLESTVPSSIAAGSYTLRAVGGDEDVTVDFAVTAPAPEGALAPATATVPVQHRRTTADDVVIGVIFGGLALISLILVASSRPRTPVQRMARVAGLPVQEPLQPSSQRAS